MTNFTQSLTEQLEPIAAWFRSFGIPEPITHWGHPMMMGIVVVVMGSFTAYAGWQSRLATDKEVAEKSRADHRKLAPFVFLFVALGYTGGVLSLVMQHQPILQSPHFWTGTATLGLMAISSLMPLWGFWGDKSALRIFHAYLGTAIAGILIVHAVFGIQLGLAI